MFSFSLLALTSLAQSAQSHAVQEPLIQSQNVTFNSTFSLTNAQIAVAGGLEDSVIHNFEVALNFEHSNYAGYLSAAKDPFYGLPKSFDQSNPPSPGTVIKVEENTNTSFYTIPPSLSMSRFLYMTETLNGTSIPASAYILWPYTPRRFSSLKSSSGNTNSSVYPAIGLAHGSSGQTIECAPSHIRALWDDFHEPFTLALNGYAVVAPDYAGLGVSGYPSPYFILPAQANDLFHAVAAAQSAFPSSLSTDFVLMGQSQGAGTTWSAAQRQAQRPVQGYLGTIAASPFTNVLAAIKADNLDEDNVRIVGIAQGLKSVLPTFQLSDWLTETGIKRLSLLQEVGGCSTAAGFLFGDEVPIVKPGWNETDAAKWYSKISNNGGKKFAGPMLVLQGDMDPNANVNVTAASVKETCDLFPHSNLQYLQYSGITHVPVLYAAQHLWMDWIADRFNGVEATTGCTMTNVGPTRGVANGAGQRWVVEYDQYNI